MLQNDTLCIISGVVSQKSQRSKHCIWSERYSMEKIVVYVLFTAAIEPLDIIMLERNYM